jgi:hypothetical protein
MHSIFTSREERVDKSEEKRRLLSKSGDLVTVIKL